MGHYYYKISIDVSQFSDNNKNRRYNYNLLENKGRQVIS